MDCGRCRGGGGIETYAGSWYGPPDGIDCLECEGTGQVPVTTCENCGTNGVDCYDVDGIAICATCRDNEAVELTLARAS